jgi:hypothetical protein
MKRRQRAEAVMLDGATERAKPKRTASSGPFFKLHGVYASAVTFTPQIAIIFEMKSTLWMRSTRMLMHD